MIHVLAEIEVNPGCRDQWTAAFRGLVPLVHAEQGCIEYGPAVDIQTPIKAQQAPRANIAVVIEKWENVPALEAHLVAPHMLAYREQVKDLVKDTKVYILQPV